MSVTIDPSILANPALRPVVERAETIFADVLNVAVNRADRRWELVRDARGRPAVRLHVTDEIVSGEITLTPAQLADPDRLKGRLLTFWGDVLEEKSHKQQEKLRQLVAALED